MQGIPVILNGGVNFSDPVSHLAPNELAYAKNCHYLPESQQLAKILGRTSLGSLSAQARALKYFRFQGGSAFLVGAAGSNYYTSPLDGTWTSRTSGLSPVGDMEGAYFAGTDRIYLADGVNRLQVWTGSGNTRNGGLDRPTVGTIALLANAATEYQVGTTFSYTHTEYDPTNDIESAPAPVVHLASSAAGDTFKYTLPATQANSSVSGLKYRIYRTQHGRGVFYLLAEIDGTNLRYYDGSDTDGLSNDTDNNAVWGFITVDDIFVSSQKFLAMVGQPLISNYITVNGTPPVGDIVTVFQNSLIIGGIPGYDQDWFFSEADYPEAFSPVNYVREENPRGDPLVAMGIANQRLISFLLNSIYRHDALPLVTNPGFTLGQSRREPVTEEHGCIAKRSVTNFGLGQSNNMLFYLSALGPMVTDGYETHPVGEDLNWSRFLVNFAHISGAVARTYPKYSQIRLFLPSQGSLINDFCMIFHYHPNHAKIQNGRLIGTWTGPVPMRCADAAVAHEENTETRMFIVDSDTSGNVFQEDNGLKDEQLIEDSAGNIDWEWISGDNAMEEQSRMKRVGRIFFDIVGAKAFTSTVNVGVNKADRETPIELAVISENAPGTLQIGTSLVDRPKSRTLRAGIHQDLSHLRLHMQESTIADRQLAHLEIEIEKKERQR